MPGKPESARSAAFLTRISTGSLTQPPTLRVGFGLDPCRGSESGEPLSEVERALWRDSELLTRIEAVLDDPDTAVPLEELD